MDGDEKRLEIKRVTALNKRLLFDAYMHKQVVELGGKIFHKENFQEIFRGVENFSFPLFSEF